MHDLGQGVWGIDGSLRMMPGLSLPLRATVLRATDGGLVLISPVNGIADWGPALDAVGNVTHVVAPSGFHHLFAKDAWERYPGATLWASHALQKKRPDFPASTRWLEGDAPLTVAPGITAWPVLGMPAVQEWVFVHEPSGTLVVTDLLFHIKNPGFLLGLVQRMFGTYDRLAVSKLFTSARRDAAAYSASLATIAGLEFDRLVVAHGENILEGAHARVGDALRASP